MEFNREYPSLSDLIAFMNKYRPDAVDAASRVIVLDINDNGYNPNRPTHETNLDVQYGMAIAYPISLIPYSTGPV